MFMCIGSDTWGDVGTLSLGELFDERVSVGRPNLLLKEGKSVSVRYSVMENLLKKSYYLAGFAVSVQTQSSCSTQEVIIFNQLYFVA